MRSIQEDRQKKAGRKEDTYRREEGRRKEASWRLEVQQARGCRLSRFELFQQLLGHLVLGSVDVLTNLARQLLAIDRRDTGDRRRKLAQHRTVGAHHFLAASCSSCGLCSDEAFHHGWQQGGVEPCRDGCASKLLTAAASSVCSDSS